MILLFLVFLCVPVAAEVWTVDDILLAERASAFDVSRDGKLAVYVKARMDKEKGTSVSHIYLRSLTEDYELQLRALRSCRFHNLPEVLNTVQRSRDSMGVVEDSAQNAITLEASRVFLAEEETRPALFDSVEAVRFARARAEYYLGDLAASRRLLAGLLRRAPLHGAYLRYFLPTLLGAHLHGWLRRSGLLSRLSAPLRRRRFLRRQLLP